MFLPPCYGSQSTKQPVVVNRMNILPVGVNLRLVASAFCCFFLALQVPAASFSPIPFQDPFPPAVVPGLPSQPGTTVELSESLSLALPYTVPASAKVQAGLTNVTIEWAMKQKTAVPSGNPSGTLVQGPGFKIIGDWQNGTYGTIFVKFDAAKDGVWVGQRTSSQIYLSAPDNQWHYYTVTFDRRTVTTFVDGELYSQVWLDNFADRIGPMANDSNVPLGGVVAIGSNLTPDSYAWNSTPAKSLRLSSVALTAAQVRRNFENYRNYQTILFASPIGQAGNPGTEAQPLSLAGALAQAGPARKIILLPGTYNGSDFQVTTGGASPLDHCLITGADGADAAILQTSGGSATPKIQGAGHVVLRNLTFASASTEALKISSAPKRVTVDACRFSCGEDGLIVNASPVLVQNSIFDVGQIALNFIDSSGSITRNNTMVGGMVGVQYDNSSSATLMNNLISAQGDTCVIFNSPSHQYFRGDGNVYQPLTASKMVRLLGVNYATTDLNSYRTKWYNLDDADSDDPRSRRIAHSAESRSFPLSPIFLNPAGGDYRLAPVTANAIDAGVATVFQRSTAAPVYDASGAPRPQGNAVDVGAYETAGPFQQSFFFTNGVTTSAAVYQTNGTLVKTLWSGRRMSAGLNTAYWNGLSDGNTAVSPGEYNVKLIAHNVSYVWEGAIGNSSALNSGPTVHANFLPVQSMAVSGNNVYYVPGYNEGKYEVFRFQTGDPQKITKSFGPIQDIFSDPARVVATDGTWIYTMNSHLLTAYTVSSSTRVNFTGGQSSLDVGTTSPNSSGLVRGDLKGMAVQAGGNILFTSHRTDFQVYMFDKRSGAALGSIVVVEPRELAVTPAGDLWVSCKVNGQYAVVRYNNFGAGGQVAATITGFQYPLALAVSPVDNTLLVADGGSSQQIKAFDLDGNPLWTLGQAGGYNNGPDVTNDKFGFYFLYGSAIPKTFLTFQSDGSFWVGDSATARAMHFSAQRQFIERFMYVPHTYVATVDANNPARVFNMWLEFSVDYAQPLAQGWTVTKFYGNNLPSALIGTLDEGLLAVATLSNGRTYALLPDGQNNGGKRRIAELTAAGLRLTPTTQLDNSTTLEADGSLQATIYSGGFVQYNRRALTGFDGSNNPQWAAASTAASAPYGGTWMNYHPAGRRFHLANGLAIAFEEYSANNGYHLGAVKQGSNQWLWRAVPSAGGLDGLGRFDSWCEYGGNLHMVSGRNIFFGFHGEFYLNQGQANQFMHYYDNGLFVGQFGQPLMPVTGFNAPGSAGNSFSPALIQTNGQMYLYHNDEASRGSHRWRADGWNEIQEFIAPLSLSQTPNLIITASDPTASESGTTGSFDITRSGSTDDDLTVNLVITGTASNGLDYVAISNSVTILAGASTAHLVVTPIADLITEGPETVILSVGGSANYNVSVPNIATVTIQDAGLPTVSIAATVLNASETGPTPGTFVITRTTIDTSLTVNFTITGTAVNGVDYQTITNSVTLPIGAFTATITITPIDDALIEGAETVVLTLSANVNYNLASAKSATVTIADNDAPTVNVVATVPSVAENATTNYGVFTVSRSSIAGGALTVYFTIGGSAVNGVDYQTISNSVTIPSGFSSTTVRVTPIDDLNSEPTQTVTLTLANNAQYQAGPNTSATVSIIDNEPPTVAPSDLQVFPIPTSGSQILLFWSYSGVNATGIKIERSRDGTNFFPIATVSAADNTYLSSRLNPQTTYYYRVNAVNGESESPYSNVASDTTGSPTLSPFQLNVNFQPASVVVPIAYEADDGIVYGNRGNGYTYGWTQEATANGVDRDSANSPEPRYYNFSQMQNGGSFTWELALPIGIYDVSGVMGDPDAFNGNYNLLVEGVSVLNEAPTDGGRWLGWSTRVTVTDGKLTISNGASAVNNKIDFLTVTDTGLSPLLLSNPQMVRTNGTNLQFRFDIAVQPGQTYVVQASTNLASTNWTSISTNSAVSNLLHFVDLKATNYHQRFYRVVIP